MELKTRFSCGDRVYSISRDRKTVITPCATCLGEKNIIVQGESFRCPKCYGQGHTITHEPLAWGVAPVGGLTIGRVRVEHTDSRGISDVIDNYKSQKGHEEVYMCNETGVGSGTLWSEDLLFATKEEAQEECDRRNACSEKSKIPSKSSK